MPLQGLCLPLLPNMPQLTYHGALAIDDNDKPVMGGTSSVDNSSIVNSAYDPTTRRLLVDASGIVVNSFVYNEIVSGSGTAWTLAHTPVLGTQAVYANGQRLTPGVGQDYTITGSAITTALSWSSGTVLADYQD